MPHAGCFTCKYCRLFGSLRWPPSFLSSLSLSCSHQHVICILFLSRFLHLLFFFLLTLDDPTDAECKSDLECPNEKACINFQCVDPCGLRGACGLNALCRTVLHRPRCSCPACHVGAANEECIPDPKCITEIQPRPSAGTNCTSNSECPNNLACNMASKECYNPCNSPSFKCNDNKKCDVLRHKATCVCKNGFIVNERGEIACAPDQVECSENKQCPTDKACVEGRCVDPCLEGKKYPCPKDKACAVYNHQPTCICMKNCSPSLSICLRDNGCPQNQACRAFRCEDPCTTANCPDNTPCYVEDHKPVCKFCPPGYIRDSKYGCLKGKTRSWFQSLRAS